MLKLLLGRAGSGKTTKLFEIIKEKSLENQKMIFLTPEQFSFETEKKIYRILGAKQAKAVKVLSFTRLAYEIFKEYGGFKKELTDMQKQLLMAVALNELKDNLNVYNEYKNNSSFISSMVNVIEDFKSAGISDDDLLLSATKIDNQQLSSKLNDLSSIFTAYNAVIAGCGADTKDNLSKAYDKALGNNYFNEKVVFIDSFMAFTPLERKMLTLILQQSKEVYGAFCCDEIRDKADGLGVFSPVCQTVNKIINICKNSLVDVKTPDISINQYRFNSSGLKAIEEQFLSEHFENEVENENGIDVFAASNTYDEIIFIASQIKKAVFEEKIKYGEIAIISRSFSRYENIIKRVFEKYEIPYYMDHRVDISTTPMIIAIKSVIDAVYSNYETEYILKYAKSPLSKLDEVEASLLDNYCYMWSINKKDWLEDFKDNPRGLSQEQTDDDRELLNKINEYRKTVIEPIISFKKSTENCDGATFAKALYELLVYFNPMERMEEITKSLSDEEKIGFMQFQANVWENLIEILNVFTEIIGDRKMSMKTYNELFFICIANCDLGQIPQTLDHVIIGTSDRIRPDDVKYTFVIGCIEGEFPLEIKSNGILTDSERNKLSETGLELTANIDERASYENHYAYFAITRASQRLFLSYPMTDLTGKVLTPSVIITEALSISGKSLTVSNKQNLIDKIWNRATAIEQFADNAQDELMASIEDFINKTGESFNDIVKQNIVPNKHIINSNELINDIVGKNIRVSASQLEKFYNCKFKYFVENTLKIKEIQKVDISALETGLVIHFIMEQMLLKYGRDLSKLSKDILLNETKRLLQEYLAPKLNEDSLSPRLKYLFERICENLTVILEHLGRELEQSLFIPMYFEEKIGVGERFSPKTLMGSDGTKITVEGYVDRIDVMTRDNEKYIRVIDYKSGDKTFNLSDIKYGLNMQMFIYLFSICPEFIPLSDIRPAGILYMPSKNTIIKANSADTAQDIQLQKDKTLKMSGLILDNPTVIYAMEQGGKGVFIPAKLNDDNETDKKSSVVSLKHMNEIKNIIEKNIIEMSDILKSGDVSAIPSYGGGYDPCQYCRFSIACGNDSKREVNHIFKLSNQELFGGDDNECN